MKYPDFIVEIFTEKIYIFSLFLLIYPISIINFDIFKIISMLYGILIFTIEYNINRIIY